MITLGADVEMFFTKGGKAASAIGLLGGDKANPVWVDESFNIQEDNVLAEFAITPCTTVEEWTGKIGKAVSHLQLVAQTNGMGLEQLSSSVLDDVWLQTDASKVFGCSPDMDAYAGVEKRPEPAGNLRTAGGHIHVGYQSDFDMASDLAKWMDIFLGVPSVLMDKDQRRRELYGQAGSYRMKPYGIEYRVLSNFWLSIKEWAWENTHVAYERCAEDEPPAKWDVRSIINNGDVDGAKRIVKEMGVVLP